MPQLKSTKTKLFLIQFLAIIPYLLFIFYLFDLWFETSRSHVLEINLNEAKLLSLYLHDNLTHGLSVSKTLAIASGKERILSPLWNIGSGPLIPLSWSIISVIAMPERSASEMRRQMASDCS